MPYYELLALASARTTRAGLVDLTTRTAAAFLDGGATLTRLATLPPAGAPAGAPAGPRRLAYRIRRNQVNHHYAYYLQFCGAFLAGGVARGARLWRWCGVDGRRGSGFVQKGQCGAGDALWNAAEHALVCGGSIISWGALLRVLLGRRLCGQAGCMDREGEGWVGTPRLRAAVRP